MGLRLAPCALRGSYRSEAQEQAQFSPKYTTNPGTPPAILPRRVVSNRREFLAAQNTKRKPQAPLVCGSRKHRVERSAGMLEDG